MALLAKAESKVCGICHSSWMRHTCSIVDQRPRAHHDGQEGGGKVAPGPREDVAVGSMCDATAGTGAGLTTRKLLLQGKGRHWNSSWFHITMLRP